MTCRVCNIQLNKSNWFASLEATNRSICKVCACKATNDYRRSKSTFAIQYPHKSNRWNGHGLSRSSTYRTWRAMKNRCYKPTDNRWKYYGSRGIKVCSRWFDFRNFLADMGERPIGRTIDRINTDLHYMPSNCRWATPKEQANNRRLRKHAV